MVHLFVASTAHVALPEQRSAPASVTFSLVRTPVAIRCRNSPGLTFQVLPASSPPAIITMDPSLIVMGVSPEASRRDGLPYSSSIARGRVVVNASLVMCWFVPLVDCRPFGAHTQQFRVHAPDNRTVQVRLKVLRWPQSLQFIERRGCLGRDGGIRPARPQQQHARPPTRFRFPGRFEKDSRTRR